MEYLGTAPKRGQHASIKYVPPVTHRSPEVIAAEIAAVDAFKGTKKDAFEALWGR
jgi:hypothetical protein